MSTVVPPKLGPLPALIFSSRWLQLPLYLGLIVAQGVYVFLFIKGLWHLIHDAPSLTEQAIMLIVLGLIDVVMISNLLVMVIVGGSGNNFGAVLGGFLIWFLWIEVEPVGLWLMNLITSGMPADSELREHLLDTAAHMRLITMGLILLLVLRFSPRGLIPER